ncbi:response regulator transcription factor [Alicyclobacillus fastidiosus]|uniref:Response regulator transcription factor n=1 Tax=Alicyclobacillus fastidiosus TaxID=392011 RepID=A0ABV5AET4_9BACL|nr:response regulator transcription factor [Alicyclobacillus fastidiosus]WEH09524.1 response regulator transcription factor [Alicyclobacillus fastidiosus]
MREASAHTSPVLIIEDDQAIADLIAAYLNQSGYTTQIAHDGDMGLALFRSTKPLCVILDRMLPGVDGLTLCKTIRSTSDVPVLFVTARLLEQERIEGLRSGADDYIVKPFSFGELVARVEAVLRRSRTPNYAAGSPTRSRVPLRIDEAQCLITWHGEALILTQSEYKLLAKLMAFPERVFSREDLLAELYPYADMDVIDRVIDVHIGNIRKKLRTFGEEAGECIQTVRGFGYRLTYEGESSSN